MDGATQWIRLLLLLYIVFNHVFHAPSKEHEKKRYSKSSPPSRYPLTGSLKTPTSPRPTSEKIFTKCGLARCQLTGSSVVIFSSGRCLWKASTAFFSPSSCTAEGRTAFSVADPPVQQRAEQPIQQKAERPSMWQIEQQSAGRCPPLYFVEDAVHPPSG